MFNCKTSASRSRAIFVIALACCSFLSLPRVANAQVTSGSISGTVSTSQDKSGLPGVTVEAIHQPTGTRYSAVSGNNGYFQIPNARVGGPYRITANLEGFRPATVEKAEVRIGETTNVSLALSLPSVTDTITVTASSDIINPNHTGSESQVSTKQIETLPTVNRTLQDYARTNPYFSVDPQDPSSTRLYVAGRNNRYNNIQIDGAVNNDLFGLADTGTPGGQANANPISLDAIQQLQLVVSPYDVRQGGFTGGGINAVTRSGSNGFEGSVFGTKRNPRYVGKEVPALGPSALQPVQGFNVINKPITTFEQTQYGGRFGGPIVHDRLFFFINGEKNTREEPTGVGVNDPNAATSYANATQDAICGGVAGCSADRLRQVLTTKYGFDPGPLTDFPKNTPSKNLFGRLDLSVTNSNQLTLRHNYVKGSNDVVSNRNAGQFRFQTATYNQANTTNSSVIQLNSVMGATVFSEARLGRQKIKDQRVTPAIFPSIEIGGAGQNATLNAGTERFSGANALDQTITEFTDDITFIRGNHTIVVGTHDEVFKFRNLFLSEFYGYYFYPTLTAFEAGQASEYRISFATGSDPKRPTAFDASQYGLYVNDQWHVSNNLTFSFGVRGDRPNFPNSPSFNEKVQTAIGYNTSNKPHDTTVISPRLGFNWNPQAGGNQQVRGGIGIFAGRAPYVWISNAYGGTGVDSVALVCSAATNCTRPLLNPDVNQQPRNLTTTGGAAISVDLVDPNFKFPRVLRGTLGYDRDLFWGIRGTIEGLWTKTQEDVYYTNVNRVQNGTSPLDGRPTYALVNPTIFDATMLTNTGKGSEKIQTLQLNRPFSHGLTMTASYAHSTALSAFDATSSRAISNWRFQHTQGDIFSPTIGRSAFEVKHRVNASVSYSIPTGPLNHTFGLYWNAQAGRPYSLLFGTDINKDQYSSNDLLYLPGGADRFILCPSTATKSLATAPCATAANVVVPTLDSNIFQNFVRSTGINPDTARILNKYQAREPWSRELDLHYALALPVSRARTEITGDIFNLLHAISSKYGNVYFVSNQNTSPVTYLGQDPTTGKPVYREASTTPQKDANGATIANTRDFGSLTPGRQFSVADLRSRWQARVGLRVSF